MPFPAALELLPVFRHSSMNPNKFGSASICKALHMHLSHIHYVFEAVYRMTEVQEQDCRNNDCAFQSNEIFLRIGKMTFPSFTQLSHAEYAPREYTESRNRQCKEKSLERPGATENSRLLVWGNLASGGPTAVCTPREVGGKEDKEEQSCYLESQSSNHDVVAFLRVLTIVCRDTGHASASSLEHEGDEVARNEDFGVGEWLDTRVLGTNGSDNAREAEIDACSEECGGDGQADNLDEEWVLCHVSLFT